MTHSQRPSMLSAGGGQALVFALVLAVSGCVAAAEGDWTHAALPTRDSTQAVPMTAAASDAAAWMLLWRNWMVEARKEVPATAAGQAQFISIALEAADRTRRLVDDGTLPLLALIPPADLLAELGQLKTAAGSPIGLAIARMLVARPLLDKVREGAAPDTRLLRESDGFFNAITMADACGGIERDGRFYQELLASPRWRQDPESRAQVGPRTPPSRSPRRA